MPAKNQYFGYFYSTKRSRLAFPYFSEKHGFEEAVFGEKKHFWNIFYQMIQILNQSAYNASDFEMKLF